jgi:hypothetical protein
MILDDLKSAAVSCAASGDNTIIAAPGAGKQLVIDHLNFIVTSAVAVTFKSGSTSLSGAYPFDTKQAIALDNAMQAEKGVITCGVNEAFIINLGGAVQVSGFVRYRILNG